MTAALVRPGLAESAVAAGAIHGIGVPLEIQIITPRTSIASDELWLVALVILTDDIIDKMSAHTIVAALR